MKLENQVALITGGSHGLGLAIARALAAEGAAVGLLARPGPKLDEAVASLRAAGARTLGLGADATRANEVEAAVKRALDEWQRLDIVVLNAGTWAGARLVETTEEQWDSLLGLNLKAAFLTLRHTLPTLIERKRGTVVGISSLGGLVGQPGASAYAASKWGLRGLLESVALEVKPNGVRVSLVYPHNINSAGRAIAAGSEDRERNLEPDEIASLIGWICSAPDHVSIGNVTVWPIHAGIKAQL
jgi:3-oxoacyl-[acyl-carrier protein] reductase